MQPRVVHMELETRDVTKATDRFEVHEPTGFYLLTVEFFDEQKVAYYTVTYRAQVVR